MIDSHSGANAQNRLLAVAELGRAGVGARVQAIRIGAHFAPKKVSIVQ